MIHPVCCVCPCESKHNPSEYKWLNGFITKTLFGLLLNVFWFTWSPYKWHGLFVCLFIYWHYYFIYSWVRIREGDIYIESIYRETHQLLNHLFTQSKQHYVLWVGLIWGRWRRRIRGGGGDGGGVREGGGGWGGWAGGQGRGGGGGCYYFGCYETVIKNTIKWHLANGR